MRGQRKLNRSAMIFSNSAGTLGSPPVAMPSSGV
jgi:hypothetical protein